MAVFLIPFAAAAAAAALGGASVYGAHWFLSSRGKPAPQSPSNPEPGKPKPPPTPPPRGK
ncbi:hypothetical protein BDV93DRAFT_527294 [Ceratobasidium sp. AG-I]|nr:hypothetical protein BDV93DRAFT_527294 [Ceratobasidium sp. AG-I]